MKKITAHAIMSFTEDIKTFNMNDWIESHTSSLNPLHRYEGELILENDKLKFKGKDSREERSFELEIELKKITDVYLGLDEVFTRGNDSNLDLWLKPLRIKFERNGSEKTIYLFIDLKNLTKTSENKKWFEVLKDLDKTMDF